MLSGASLSQTRVVMPTITDQMFTVSQSTQLNSIMLHHAHWFFLPLNSASLISNILVGVISLGITVQNGSLLSLHTLRSLTPAVLCVISTMHTVRMILPINDRIHALADEITKSSDSKETKQQIERGTSQEPEIRHLQQSWRDLNRVRGVILFGIAFGTISSPAMSSLYTALT